MTDLDEGSKFSGEISESKTDSVPQAPPSSPRARKSREHRRRRFRRHRRRAFIRSVYFLPSMATLGNAICGFAAIYVAAFDDGKFLEFATNHQDPVAVKLASVRFFAAAYLIFLAMVFDALDGRLARWARHTTDFGGQLDSLADVVSFGAAPAFIALLVFKNNGPENLPFVVTRLIWAIGALYFSCAAIRLARFNVSNEHGEQHHFSFLGLPSPGAAAAVVAFILMQQDLHQLATSSGWPRFFGVLDKTCVYLLPLVVLTCGMLMVSTFRYPHVINKYLRGKRSFPRLIIGLIIALLFILEHRYVLGIGGLAYALQGPASYFYTRAKSKPPIVPAA